MVYVGRPVAKYKESTVFCVVPVVSGVDVQPRRVVTVGSCSQSNRSSQRSQVDACTTTLTDSDTVTEEYCM